jgi:hypothetical protein
MTWDRGKLIDPRFVRARDVSGRGYISRLIKSRHTTPEREHDYDPSICSANAGAKSRRSGAAPSASAKSRHAIAALQVWGANTDPEVL